MTRLERAKAEYVTALQQERDALTTRLRELGAEEPPGRARRETWVRREKPAPRQAVRLFAPPPATPAKKLGRPPKPKPAPAAKRAPRRPRQFLGNLAPSSEPEGEHSCPSCGREGLRKRPGPGGVLAYHVAPEPCGLPCAGGRIDHLTPEDKPDGVHSSKACAKRCGLKGASS